MIAQPRKRHWRHIALAVFAAATLLFILAPLAIVVLTSFSSQSYIVFPPEGYSLRWYARLVLWFRLLWQISRLNPHLTAAHPDRAGGIGFLGATSYAFGPILFAQGALLSGLVATKVLFEGQNLLTFEMQAFSLIGVMVLSLLDPPVMFSPMMDRAQRRGFGGYSRLANQYVFAFEKRWIHSGNPDLGELLGTGDIHSLADQGNSFSVTREMKIVPFGPLDILRLAGATAAPLIPLTLTIFSLEEVLTRLSISCFKAEASCLEYC